MSLADTFANVEPESNLHGNKSVQSCLLDGQIFPRSGSSAGDESANSLSDSWQIGYGWWSQLNFGVLEENIEFRCALLDQV